MQNHDPLDPIWVNKPSQLEEMMAHLMEEPIVAVDTESNSLYVYQEQVCLIQITTGSRDYLVDSLALRDLSCFVGLFASPKIEKIFHAADYDLVTLKRDFQFEFTNLFDTMIAGRTLGMKSVGLASMLEEEFGLKIDKRYQRANWGQRPLSRDMLVYACRDSHYLIPLRNKLVKTLSTQNRLELVKEECAYLAKHTEPLQNHQADMWRVRGVNQLNPRQQAALQSLYEYREQIAKNNNKPPFKVMSNQALLEVAQTLPKFKQELELLPSLGKNQVQQFGSGLLQAVKESAHSQVKNIPPHVKYDAVLQKRRDRLSDWRRDKGISLDVPSDVILSREILLKIAELNPQNQNELQQIMSELPLRFTKYGEEILDVLKKGRQQ